MNKTILSLFILLLLFQGVQAQATLSLTLDEMTIRDYVNLDDPDFELISYATLKNEGSEAISIKWERVVIDMPEGWSVLVCDVNSCYEPIVYSNIADDIGMDAPVPLEPGETTNLDVHIKPNGISGAGEVRIDVSLADNPDNILISETYLFDALVSSWREFSKARLNVFPNPATDYLEVQGAPGAGRLVISNILGRQMHSFNLAPGGRYYLGGLPSGLYLASVMNQKGEILKTFRISKRAVRP